MSNIYKNIEGYNPNNNHKKQKIIIAFDNVIADMLSDKKLYPIINQEKKAEHFSCFCYKTLFCCFKKY